MVHSFIAFFVFYFDLSFACECLEMEGIFGFQRIAREIIEKGK
jgi:hypothetical protein